MKLFDALSLIFLEKLPLFYKLLLLHGKNLTLTFFGEYYEIRPLRPFYKGGGSNYVSRTKNSMKINAMSNKHKCIFRPQITS